MVHNSAEGKVIKEIEIETAALNRIVFCLVKLLTEEQREDIYHHLKKISNNLTKSMEDNSAVDKFLYEREREIHKHIVNLFANKIN
ncbi:hypothetical protein [Arsenophonus nasoniae]|uniref:Uncharacterized protein n=1 Tax=Arsenophonus nasoniae TaxID=638 RepID=A0AA95GNF9_9GAMM|nr:hypothetical protein [Arsenophonus nasoniae]WGM00049.1 hypothetical protein QE210_09025 [Arsenophonus nasoniae]